MARKRDFDEGEVLDRAMDVFWRHGYEGASFAELTKAMDINSASIYVAFGSKRGLFEAVLARYRARRRERGDYVLAGATAREVAERILFDSIEWLVDPKEPLGCLLVQSGLTAGMTNADVPPLLIEHRSRVMERLTERFASAQADGDLAQTEDPAELARYLHMAVLGLSIQAAAGLSGEDLRTSAERVLLGFPSGGRPSDCALTG